jgi:hypothetical protein
MPKKYCKKEFLTPEDEPSTSAVVSWYGDVKWDKDNNGGNVSFLEVSSCHEVVRLHRTYEMTHVAWIAQVRKLRDHVNDYLIFLESVSDEEIVEKEFTKTELIHTPDEIQSDINNTWIKTNDVEVKLPNIFPKLSIKAEEKRPNLCTDQEITEWLNKTIDGSLSFDAVIFSSGRTLAHILAICKRLPKDFNQWTITNGFGWTVAHEAANAGCLPSDFGKDDLNLWDMKTHRGLTVKEVYDEYKEKHLDNLNKK